MPATINFTGAETVSNQNFCTLLDFSLGKIDDLSAMAALGIDSTEDLFLLMAQAHLPMPCLPDSMTQALVNVLNTLPLGATPGRQFRYIER